jgi:hypothetical protein
MVSVFARGLLKRLVTRIYFPDEEEANAGDPVLASETCALDLVGAEFDEGIEAVINRPIDRLLEHDRRVAVRQSSNHQTHLHPLGHLGHRTKQCPTVQTRSHLVITQGHEVVERPGRIPARLLGELPLLPHLAPGTMMLASNDSERNVVHGWILAVGWPANH